jgi:hypothetical protein
MTPVNQVRDWFVSWNCQGFVNLLRIIQRVARCSEINNDDLLMGPVSLFSRFALGQPAKAVDSVGRP